MELPVYKIPVGFYQLIPDTMPLKEIEAVSQMTIARAKRICEEVGTDYERGRLITKFVPADPEDPESELVLTIGWKIYLTEEQYEKLKESKEWASDIS